MYLIIGQQFRAQYRVRRIMRFLISKRSQRDSRYVRGADERDPAVAASRVDLALVLDRGCVALLVGEVFYLKTLHQPHDPNLRKPVRASGYYRTHEPSRKQHAILHPKVKQMLPHLPDMRPARLIRCIPQEDESHDAVLLDCEVDEGVHRL